MVMEVGKHREEEEELGGGTRWGESYPGLYMQTAEYGRNTSMWL